MNHLTELSSLKTASRALGSEFDRMHDVMLIPKQGEIGLKLIPEKFMECLTGDVQSIAGFIADKDQPTQELFQDLFEQQFVLQLIMLKNSNDNAFSIEQLRTMQDTSREMIHSYPYFFSSATKLQNAILSYADKFNLKIFDEE